MGRRQHLAHNIEHRVVVQRIANLLQLFQEALEHLALDGIRRDEIEYQAVLVLAVAVNAPHPLFETVGVSGNVVVEEDVANLQVDSLAGGLGGHQHLYRALTELLLGVEPCTGRVS